MQGHLEWLYDTGLTHDVGDYLVTDRDILAALMAGSTARASDEQLIVVEGEGEVDVALFVDHGVLNRLAAADPGEHLSGANLADFWTVLEGVSHFHYLAWNAGFDKSVTLLELEMQAEVDKYFGTRLLLRDLPDSTLGKPLLARLFDDTAPDPRLAPEERDRYQAAAGLASRYCAILESRFPAMAFTQDLMRELRTFYRLPQAAKISRIRAHAFA
jgi:hypothetical protein